MVRRGKREVGSAHLHVDRLQPRQIGTCLQVVDQVPIDVQQRYPTGQYRDLVCVQILSNIVCEVTRGARR